MLNKENYIPWSSHLLRYDKSRPNGKLIHNSILNGPYVRKMIPEPGDANRNINITETSHLQTDDELSDKELKQIEADDQAIQTILHGLPEVIYAVVDSCKTAQEIWLRVQQMMKGGLTNLVHSGLTDLVTRRVNRSRSFLENLILRLSVKCDVNREVNVTETFHLQTDDELSDKELKQIEADDQAIQTILLGLPEDIYAAVDSCETAQEIRLRVQQSGFVFSK
nr:hypothetical protein [Tanacetum cinerariifolium]